ncbi:hypothetical protein M9H77_25629 [Catharanthus roseus]|uniref:Uncharacterized protein n=1 Tax=Catharanthus roseus TaxID=4058 RepID=A0ACC0ABG3_CATRO|nr:hypothetical protein M9H77_25629 [Catharanthus roseus]
MLLACIYQHYILKGDGECCRKGRRIHFSIESPFSLYSFNPSLKRQIRNLFFTSAAVWWCFLLQVYCLLNPRRGFWNWKFVLFSSMRTKMKGIYKAGYKYISNIFVVKEPEIEIGFPTDVKHVAHIGWDGPSGTAPSWMNEFKTGPEFAATSIGNSGSAFSPWSSQDFGESTGQNSTTEMYKDLPPTEVPSVPKAKQKRKKVKSNSSPRSTSSSTSRSSRAAAKSKAKFVEGNQNPANIEVA